MRYGRSSAEQIITHSLGARVALSALNHSGLAVKTLILMAPALDWNAFEHGGEFELVPSCCEAVHILYSNRDEVLKLAYPIGDIGGGSHALGLDGPRDPLQVPHNVFLHDVSAFIPNHTSYLSEPKCAKLVRQILGT